MRGNYTTDYQYNKEKFSLTTGLVAAFSTPCGLFLGHFVGILLLPVASCTTNESKTNDEYDMRLRVSYSRIARLENEGVFDHLRQVENDNQEWARAKVLVRS